MKKNLIVWALALLPMLSPAQRLQQPTSRGVVAVNRTGGRSVTSTGGQGSLISWRKLAQEPEGTTYNVYRRAQGASEYTKINTSPLKVTNMQTTLTANTEYAVTAVVNGVEGEKSAPFLYKSQPWPNVWFNFDFDNKVIARNDYRTKYVWPMDTDGDGEYDAVVCDRLFAGAISDEAENTENTATTTHKIQAYRLDGTLLWTVDMGPNVNICGGQNDMVVAYDINCDGRCEVMIRSSDGTRFWDKANETWGKYAKGSSVADVDGDGIVDYRQQSSRNRPFYVSVIDGLTGEEIACNELKYDEVSDGADRYTRNNRRDYMSDGYSAMDGHFAICYLDGIHPSLVMECLDRDNNKTHHNYVFTWEYDWTNGKPENWHHDKTWSRNDKRPWPAEFHQLRVADVDGDGCDEMIQGGYSVNPKNGWFASPGIGHGDRFILSDIDPDRPGLEVYAIQQSALLGQLLYDARTAERIKEWYLPSVYDVGRGACMDVDASRKGYELYSFTDDYVYDCKGEKTSYTRSGCGIKTMFEGIWWNGDLQREEISSPGGSGWGTNLMITQVLNKARLVEFSQESNWASHGSTGTRPAFIGDIIGDWREEIILAKQNDEQCTGLVGYTTNMPTNYSIYCLQQDPHYRLDCTTRGYYQHPNTGFYLGGDMPLPPLPPVFEADVRNQMASGKSVMFDLQGDNHSSLAIDHSPTMLYVMNPRGHDYVFTGKGTTGSGQLIKSMQGTATFNCDLSHTGLNLISEGVLTVNGKVGGPVELRARGTLSGNATLCDTITFEGALNYEGCRLKPVGSDGVITSEKSMVLPGNIYIEVEPGGKLSVKGDMTFLKQNTITVTAVPAPGRYVIAECTDKMQADVTQLKTRGLEGINYDLEANDHQLVLVINDTRAPATDVVWTGHESNVWDYKAYNFKTTSETPFVSGDAVVFNSEGEQKTVRVNEMMMTSGVVFDAGKYILSGDGGISGEGGVIVNKDADVTLNMKYSDYTGATIVNGGKLTIPNFYDGGQKSAIGASAAKEGNLVLNGGTLTLSKDNMGTDRIITLTDTATIRIAQANSSLSLKGQVKGNGYLVKEGPGQLNFTYGGTNSFAGLIVRQGIVAQGAWNATFGKTGGPMLLAGGEVHLIDNNSSSTMPVFNYVTTVQEGTTNKIVGTRRGQINGSFKGTGSLTIVSQYVRCDVGADFSQFEGQLTLSKGNQFRLMSNVTNMSKARVVIDAATNVGHYQGGSGTAATATTRIGSLSSTATDAVLGGANSTWQIGALGEDAQFKGIFTAKSVVKEGAGKLTLTNTGHTSPIIVNGGILDMVNTSATQMTTGLLTVRGEGMLSGTGLLNTVIVQKDGIIKGGTSSASAGTLRVKGNLTLQDGAVVRVQMGLVSGNTRLAVSGRISHNQDTLLIVVPSTRHLTEGEEIQVFESGFTSATGDVVIACESTDSYEFDTSLLNTQGKIVVKLAVMGIRDAVSDDAEVDVFTPQGLQLRSAVRHADALTDLPAGVYVISYRDGEGRARSYKATKRTIK